MKLIDLEYIAKLFNEYLGNDFIVRVDSSTDIIPNKTMCTIQADRVPFSVSSIESETLDIALTAYLNVDTEIIKNKQLKRLNDLIGTHEGVIEVVDNGETMRYRYHVFINGNKPITDPAFDMGMDCASYQLTGTMLISAEVGGGVMSNDLEVRMSLSPITEDNTGEPLAVILLDIEPNTMLENRYKSNHLALRPIIKANAKTYTMQVIMIGHSIEQAILDELENGLYNRIFYLQRNINGKCINNAVQLINGKISYQMGAYAQYTLCFQEV